MLGKNDEWFLKKTNRLLAGEAPIFELSALLESSPSSQVSVEPASCAKVTPPRCVRACAHTRVYFALNLTALLNKKRDCSIRTRSRVLARFAIS